MVSRFSVANSQSWIKVDVFVREAFLVENVTNLNVCQTVIASVFESEILNVQHGFLNSQNVSLR